MSDIAIRVLGLAKEYQIGKLVRYRTLRERLMDAAALPFNRIASLGRAGAANSANERIWALKELSFEIPRGAVVGIIGRNGAGKSTLLKILSRVTEPTKGRVEIRGRVGSLLEVGTGFHQELTGRENVFLNGAILGMKKKEIISKFDAIVDFADLSKFIDTPVKHYSSGMYMRLAFAVAAHLEPEILIVDEVLAVGDSAFQQKCLARMHEVGREGRTILFVSHDMQAIQQLCSRAIHLEGGMKVDDDQSSVVIQRYLRGNFTGTQLSDLHALIPTLPPDPAFQLLSVDVVQDHRSGTDVLSGKPIEIRIDYRIHKRVVGFLIYVLLVDGDGTLLFEIFHNGDAADIPTTLPGRYQSRAIIPADFLAGRTYELVVGAAIHCVRVCIPEPSPIRIPLHVTPVGLVNRAYPGYVSPGKIAPLIPWQTDCFSSGEVDDASLALPDL
jgi:homopolymeric O-antigen transport system ATP-binding protein